MKHNLKAEMKESMDALCFSQEDKNAMVYNLTMQMKDAQPRKGNRKKAMLVALAAVLLLGTMTGAAAFTRWSITMQMRFNPSENIKEQAENSGLSVMLDGTGHTENSADVLSCTDQGVTITAVQTMVDNYQAQITFRIEGFDLTEGELPAVWPMVSIGGDKRFGGMQSGWFYDGLTTNEAGETVYASNGMPVESDADGCLILDFTDNDGSLEYTHVIRFEETDGRYMGKEIVFSFQSIDFQSQKKAGMSIPQVEGNWELQWTLTGTDSNIHSAPNAEIGGSDVILLDAQIGQMSLRTRYQLKDYWDGWDELVELPQAVCGIRMKDGSEYICAPMSSGFEDQEKMIYFIESSMFDAIVDLSQVDSLMFHKGWEADADGNLTIQTFYYIPVSRN